MGKVEAKHTRVRVAQLRELAEQETTAAGRKETLLTAATLEAKLIRTGHQVAA